MAFPGRYAIYLVLVLPVIAWTDEKTGKNLPELTFIGDQVTFDVNNISLRMRNNSRTAVGGNAYYPAGSGMTFLFDSGVAVSGLVDDELRTAWQVNCPIVLELQPGRSGDAPGDSLARFYAVAAADTFGSANYIDWSSAVATGANFQDLDGDGLYNPLYDRPDLLGDFTYWCVYNDNTAPPGFRTLV